MERAPKNTNGVERANYSAKSGTKKPSLLIYAAMQTLYEKYEIVALQRALQYTAAEDGSEITYRNPMDEQERSQAAVKQKQ